MLSGKHLVFICHAGVDKLGSAASIHAKFVERRVTCFLDEISLQRGAKTNSELGQALKDARIAILVLSPATRATTCVNFACGLLCHSSRCVYMPCLAAMPHAHLDIAASISAFCLMC